MPLHSRSRNILNFSCLQRCASKMRQKSFKRYIYIRYSSCLRKTKGLFATFTERAPVVLTVSTLFYACFNFFHAYILSFFIRVFYIRMFRSFLALNFYLILQNLLRVYVLMIYFDCYFTVVSSKVLVKSAN